MSKEEGRIKNNLKRFLKRFPQYKTADNIDDADIALLFSIENVEKFMILALTSSNKEDIRNTTDEGIQILYLKHKNPRNKKQLIANNIDKKHFSSRR